MKKNKRISILVSFFTVLSVISLSSYASSGLSENWGQKTGWEQTNSQEQNQTQTQIYEGNGNWSENWLGTNNAMETNVQSKSEIRSRLGDDNANNVDNLINNFANDIESKSINEQKNTFQLLLWKIDWAIMNIENSNISETKKQAYKNLYEYIRVLTEEKIILLWDDS